MSAEKRNMTDFLNFGGSIDNGVYSFPIVNSKDSMNRNREWQIFIRLIISKDGKAPNDSKKSNDKNIKGPKINWDINDKTLYSTLPIEESYLVETSTFSKSLNLKSGIKKTKMIGKTVSLIPINTIAQIYQTNGIIKDGVAYDDNHRTISIPTYIVSGKNIGKKNETNVLTQALIFARSKYLKRLQMTGDSNPDGAERFFPVAVHKYDDKPRNISNHITYPCAVQRKLDGGRMVAYFNSENKPVLYSRKLKDISDQEHILFELSKVLSILPERYKGIYLDGELYKHGMSLQEISGQMHKKTTTRKEKKETKIKKNKQEDESKDESEDPKLEFHIFDIFFPVSASKSKEKLVFSSRKLILDEIFFLLKQANVGCEIKYLVKVETKIANNKELETALYHQFLKEDYEGSIVKNLNSVYEFGVNKEIRTYQMRKRKQRHSDEFKLVGYTEGDNGKDKGAIIWILETSKKLKFNATPVGMKYDERYTIFKNMSKKKFKSEYMGKMMTVEYDDLSDDGIPLRAKAKNIRVID